MKLHYCIWLTIYLLHSVKARKLSQTKLSCQHVSNKAPKQNLKSQWMNLKFCTRYHQNITYLVIAYWSSEQTSGHITEKWKLGILLYPCVALQSWKVHKFEVPFQFSFLCLFEPQHQVQMPLSTCQPLSLPLFSCSLFLSLSPGAFNPYNYNSQMGK